MNRSLASLLLAVAAATPPQTHEIAVSGSVVDAQGRPAAKVAIELTALPRAADAVAPPLAQAVTDAGGRFTLAAPDVGMYEVAARARGATAYAPLQPLLGATELPPLHLEPLEPLRVRVLGPDGRPRENARLVAWSNRAPRPRRIVADATGALIVPRRRGEIVSLAAAGDDFVEARATGVRGAAADLRAGATCARQVRVRDANGAPVAGASVSAGFFVVAKTDERGAATIAAPCARETRIAVETSDGRGARARLPGSSAEVAPVDLVVAPAAVYSGRVLDAETRAPLGGAVVWADDDPAGFVRSDAKGAYAASRGASRDDAAGVQLRAAAAGHLAASQKVAAAHAAPAFALQPTAALAGIVVDAERRPVASADVRAIETTELAFRQTAEGLPLRATTSGSGAFRIEVLPRRAYTLRASRAGFAPASLPVAEKLAPSAVRSGLRIVLSAGSGAFGTVVDDASSKPIAGAELRLTPSSDVPRFLRAAQQPVGEEVAAFSDAGGSFRFEHLPAGRFDLAASADGYARHAQSGVAVAAGAAPLDLGAIRLQRGTALEGTVVDRRDRPLSGATIAVHPPSPTGIRAEGTDDAQREATSGADGAFSVPGLRAGETVDVTARLEDYVAATVPQVEVPPREPLRIVLEPGAKISGRVVSDGGNPIAAAIVTARPADAALPAGLAGRTATTDVTGAFVLQDLAAGRLALTALAKGFVAGEPLMLDVGEGRSIDDVELTLRQGAAIEGVVLTPSGRPATAARVVLRRAASPDRMLEIEVAGAARTDGEGHYRLEGVPPGAQSVSADQEGYLRATRQIDVQPGENRLDFRLADGYGVAGRVIDGRGAPLAGVAVALFSSTPGVAHEDVSESDGSFRFAGLESGRYVLSARKEGYAPARQDVDVADRGVDGVELRLQQGAGTISGRILGLPVQQIADVRVTAVKQPLDSLDAMRDGRVDAQGSYRVDGVGAGEWAVTARLPSGREARRAVTLTESNPQAQLDLEFGQGFALSGFVRRRNAQVSGATVQATGSGSASFGSAVTDSGGAFRIEGLQAGEHRVVASVPQLGLRAERVVALSSDQTLDIDLPTARVSGRVVDATGAPLAGVIVTAEAAGAPGGFAPHATSELDGRFTLTTLGKGSYRLTGSKSGYTNGILPLELASDDAEIDDLRLVLERK